MKDCIHLSQAHRKHLMRTSIRTSDNHVESRTRTLCIQAFLRPSLVFRYERKCFHVENTIPDVHFIRKTVLLPLYPRRGHRSITRHVLIDPSISVVFLHSQSQARVRDSICMYGSPSVSWRNKLTLTRFVRRSRSKAAPAKRQRSKPFR